jgi:hypothetical protein
MSAYKLQIWAQKISTQNEIKPRQYKILKQNKHNAEFKF